MMAVSFQVWLYPERETAPLPDGVGEAALLFTVVVFCVSGVRLVGTKKNFRLDIMKPLSER